MVLQNYINDVEYAREPEPLAAPSPAATSKKSKTKGKGRVKPQRGYVWHSFTQKCSILAFHLCRFRGLHARAARQTIPTNSMTLRRGRSAALVVKNGRIEKVQAQFQGGHKAGAVVRSQHSGRVSRPPSATGYLKEEQWSPPRGAAAYQQPAGAASFMAQITSMSKRGRVIQSATRHVGRADTFAWRSFRCTKPFCQNVTMHENEQCTTAFPWQSCVSQRGHLLTDCHRKAMKMLTGIWHLGGRLEQGTTRTGSSSIFWSQLALDPQKLLRVCDVKAEWPSKKLAGILRCSITPVNAACMLALHMGSDTSSLSCRRPEAEAWARRLRLRR